MTKRALLVGIDDYPDATLEGCVADATEMAELLRHHEDDDDNFHTVTLTAPSDEITRSMLRKQIGDLFSNATGYDLLFYFAGHGALTDWGAELVTVDYEAPAAYGVSMSDIAALARKSSARSVTVILDCCFSGDIGNDTGSRRNPGFDTATLREGMTLLSATRPEELAQESGGHGAFTRALIDGLQGGAADLLGRVTAHALYAYVCRTFGDAWHQQPVFKSHAFGDIVLRKCRAALDRATLRRLVDRFSDPAVSIRLTPASVDASTGLPMQDDLRDLISFGAVGLVSFSPDPDGVAAALLSGQAELTLMGRHYWDLVDNEQI